MIWYNNPLLKTSLQMILKKSNQRIVQLGKTFGTSSYTFNQYTSILSKGPVQEFTKQSRSGNLALDIRKVFRAVETGRIDRNTLNQILTTMAGVKVDQNGEIQDAQYTKGVPTVSEIRKQTKKRLINQGEDPREMSLAEIDDATELYFDFSTNFDTSYSQAMKELGESKMRKHPVVGKLWQSGKKSYDELIEIKKYLDTYRRDAKNAALKLEE